MPFLDITGKRFGRLEAKKFIRRTRGKGKSKGKTYWRCLCKRLFGGCGNYVTVELVCLRNGQTKSCGCLRRDIAREKGRKQKRRLSPGEIKEAVRLRVELEFTYASLSRMFRISRSRIQNLVSELLPESLPDSLE